LRFVNESSKGLLRTHASEYDFLTDQKGAAMRYLLAAMLPCLLLAPTFAQGSQSTLDRQISEALREVHDRGAELYNSGDTVGGYRIYQGALVFAQKMLGHRPELQKVIGTGMSAADKEPTVDKRAFALHELIEYVRGELRTSPGKGGETLTVPPREVKPAEKTDPKPSAGISEVKSGVIGRVFWQSSPVASVDVTFVTLGKIPPRVYETTTSAQGTYVLPDVQAGKYVVLVAAGGSSTKKLPERYALASSSPLVLDILGNGEKFDLLLQ
jgi:hypothetical protein